MTLLTKAFASLRPCRQSAAGQHSQLPTFLPPNTASFHPYLAKYGFDPLCSQCLVHVHCCPIHLRLFLVRNAPTCTPCTQIAAELLRIGPYHSPDDFWTPKDWQLLLVVAEYMSALLEVRVRTPQRWGRV